MMWQCAVRLTQIARPEERTKLSKAKLHLFAARLNTSQNKTCATKKVSPLRVHNHAGIPGRTLNVCGSRNSEFTLVQFIEEVIRECGTTSSVGSCESRILLVTKVKSQVTDDERSK